MKSDGVKRQNIQFRKPLSRTLILTMSILTLLGIAAAQSTSGSIFGTITDPSGAVISNAQISETNVKTGVTQNTRSNGSGNYLFPDLPYGVYSVTVKTHGFQSATQSGIHLNADSSVHVSFTLKLGSATQHVTVTAGTTLVNTRSSELSETIQRKQMEDLPLNGRDAYDLVQIVPGVTNYQPDSATGSREGSQMSVNGIPQQNTAYYLDGAYDTNNWRFGGDYIPNPSALQEFRILTTDYNAEWGRSPGGVVNVITRSGTNQFHGKVYDYLRNNVLNAKNYFLNSVAPLKQNQFGATIGGPILRNKSFFFFAYQGMRIRKPANVSSASLVTPTALEAAGDFRDTPAKMRPNVSCNGVQYVICPDQLDPVAQNLLKNFVPVGSSAPGSQYGHPAQQSANANVNENQEMANVVLQLPAHNRLSVMYFMSRGVANDPTAGHNQIVSYAGMKDYEGQYNAVASDTSILSPTKVNTLRMFYTLSRYIIGNIYGNQHMLADIGSKAAEGNPLSAQPYFDIRGYWQMGTKNHGPNDLSSPSLGASDDFMWMRGNHEIKLGGSFIWDRFDSTGGGSSNGLFMFTGSTSGNALADFLEGHATSLKQNNGVDFRNHSADPSLFALDDWRATHRLTLNLGLRWELFPPYTGQNDTGTFVPYVQSQRFPTAPLGLLSSGDPGIPDGIFHTPWNTIAPRVGFAYDVFGNGKTSIRGGYGIFYEAIDEVRLSDLLVQQPFSRSITVSKIPNLVTPFAPNSDPFPYTPNPQHAVFLSGATIYGLPPGDKNLPSVQEYNINIEQQLGANWMAKIAYVGNVSHHVYLTHDQNAPKYSPTCTKACLTTNGLNERRPYQPTPNTYTFGEISINGPWGNASYNSLQITLRHRFASDFSLLASYVWSKAMGDGAPVNQNELASSHGPLSIDVPQRFVAAYIWQSPSLHRWGVFGKQLLSGWKLTGITTLSTGGPFDVTSGTDTNFDGETNDRPNVVGNPVFPGGRSRTQKIKEFFNTSAFTTPPIGTPYGNTSYDSLIGPGYVNTNLSASKSFPVYRNTSLQFRGSLFNTFNNVNLENPNADLSSPKFGTISSANSPRIVQFALQYLF